MNFYIGPTEASKIERTALVKRRRLRLGRPRLQRCSHLWHRRNRTRSADCTGRRQYDRQLVIRSKTTKLCDCSQKRTECRLRLTSGWLTLWLGRATRDEQSTGRYNRGKRASAPLSPSSCTASRGAREQLVWTRDSLETNMIFQWSNSLDGCYLEAAYLLSG